MSAVVTKRILGQLAPGAGQEDLIYEAPLGGWAEWHSLTMCNRSGSDESVSVRVSPCGVNLADVHYLYAALVIKAHDQGSAEHDIELGPGDRVHVKSSGGGVSFSLFGREVLEA